VDVKDSSKYRSPFASVAAQAGTALAWVSGIFSAVLCVIVVVNHIQVETADPLDDKMLAALKGAIAKDPTDRETRESLRRLHLMARRAFFTNQTQLRTGGLLLLGGVAIFLASMKTLVELKRVNPVPTGSMPVEGGPTERAAARWAVAAGSGVLAVVTLFIVFVSPPEIYFEVPEPGKAAAAVTADVPAPAPAHAPAPAPKPGPAAAPAVAPSATWPSLRGPLGTGTSAAANTPLAWNGKTGEGILWKSPIEAAGTSSPVVWGKKVFVTGSDGKTHFVYGYDADSGKLLWTGSLPGTLAGAPKVEPAETTSAANTPAVDGSHVYAIFNTGDVAAFTHDGQRVWAKHVGPIKLSYGYTSSLAAVDGRVIVQVDAEPSGRLLALDGRTGQPVWETKWESVGAWSSPVVVNTGARTEILVASNPRVAGHDPATGKALWSLKVLKGEVAPSPACAGGRAFFGTDHALMAGVDLSGEPKQIWTCEEDLPDASSPVATATHLFMCASSGIVTCLDAKTGAKAWMHDDFNEGFYGSPVMAGDRIYVMDRAGVTHVFKASGEKFERLAENPLGEKADCTPAVVEGRIYLRSLKFLYCAGKGGT
jgi:outer membrane protein assembly factor BamB